MRVTGFDIFVVLIDKEQCGNALRVSEGHRELRCTILSCMCCICNKTEYGRTANSVTVYRPSVPTVCSCCHRLKVFVMLSAAEMLARFINSYMNWDGEYRYCGNWVETEKRKQELLCYRMIPEGVLG
jgi:hypothetical protein